MVNRLLPLGKEALLDALLDWSDGGTNWRMVAVSDAFTPTDATDQFLSVIPAGQRLATSELITTRTSTAGVADCDDISFLAGSQITGTADNFYIYQDTGVDTTSRLLPVFDDENNGIPYSVDDAPFTFQVNALGLFAL